MAISKLADYLLQNPLYAYGENVAAQGASMAPVHSTMEGLARALTGGVGGFFAGQGLQQAKGEQKLDQSALAQAMEKYTTDPTGARALLATRPNLSDTATALLTSDVGFQRQKDLLDYTQAQNEKSRAADMAMFGITPPTAAPSGQPGPQVAGTNAGFDNNVGNLRTSNASWDGKGQPYNGFETFGTPQAGAAAMYKNLQSYVQANPGMTVADAIAKYAPPSENNTAAYVAHIAKSGIDPRAPLANVLQTPQTATQLLSAMAQHEKGKQYSPDIFTSAVSGQPPPQGGDPGAAPGQPQAAPQTANNVPAGDTIDFQGVKLPKSAVAAAMMIRDPKERQSKLVDIARDAIKLQQEGAPVERVRQADGSELIVPRAQAAGMSSAQQVPPPGSVEGDEDLLRKGDPRDPAYAGAFYRVANKPIDGPNGQKYLPNMTSMGYRPPGGPAGQTQTAQAGQVPGSAGMTPVGQPNYNETQNKNYVFAQRLEKSIPQLEQWVKDEQGNLSSGKLPSYVQQFGSGSSMVPEMLVGDKARQYRQIVQDIVTATLRPESGSAIQPSEFATEAQKYIPQAKDSPQVIKQKLEALRTEAKGIASSTGRSQGEFKGIFSGSGSPGSAIRIDINGNEIK